jgi:hypothetical protein
MMKHDVSKVLSLTKKTILSCKLPGDLFTSPEAMEDEYIALSKRWHPDKEGSNHAMAQINTLRDQGLKDIDNATWQQEGKKIIPLDKGNLVVNFLAEHPFELGTMFVCETSVIYKIKSDCTDFISNMKKTVPKKFVFNNSKMKKEVEKYLPRVIATYDAKDKDKLVIIAKTDDLFLLSDVLRYFDGKIPPKHVAWILSSIYNFACYLNFIGVAHNGLTIDSYFISPEFHSGVLIGGWWYSVEWDKSMVGVPGKIYDVLPTKIKSDKKGDCLADLEAVKLIGRELLGDKNGNKLYLDKDIPEPISNFLRLPAESNAVEEYRTWGQVLKAGFGPRRFIELKINRDEFYKQLKKKT